MSKLDQRALYREVDRLITEALCRHGMERRKRGIFTRELTSESIGVVGLNEAKKYDYAINPIIGVHYPPLERLLGELDGRVYDPLHSGSTIACPIGYLGQGKRFRQWHFEEGRDNAATVAEMVQEITTTGFRYMEANTTLQSVVDRLLIDRHFIMGNDVYQLPVGLMMLGRYDEAAAIVAKHAEMLSYYPVPDDYRRFADQFFQRLEQERGKSARRPTDADRNPKQVKITGTSARTGRNPAERKRLKKLGKEMIAEQSQELRQLAGEVNPAQIGSDEWVRNYKAGIARERRIRVERPDIIPAATAAREFVLRPVPAHSHSVPTVYIECPACGDLLHTNPRTTVRCSCGSVEMELNLENNQIHLNTTSEPRWVQLIGRGSESS